MRHPSLAAGRWQTLTLLEQLGNIGSEVGRALKPGVESHQLSAAERALELFDLTLADKRWQARGAEILRAREVFCDYLFGDNQYQSNARDLERYFMQFAVAARLHK